MKSIKMMKFDIRNFFLKNKKRFWLPVVFSVLSYLILCCLVSNAWQTDAVALGKWDRQPVKVTFLDWWYYVFAGLGRINVGEKFEVPACWIVSNLFLLFMVSGYVSFAMKGMGKLVMIKCNSEKKWWLTKGVINILAVMIYYSLLAAPVFFITLARSCAMGGFTPFVAESTALPCPKDTDTGSIVQMILLPMAASLALLFVMELLELYLGASLSFLFMAAFMIVAAYLSAKGLNGVFLMLRRTVLFPEGEVSWIQVVCSGGVLILLSQIFGCRRCRAMDIGLEGDRR